MSKAITRKITVVGEDGRDLGPVSVSLAGNEPYERVVVLAHGAGGDMNSRLLLDVQDGLVEHSIAVIRFNFLYTEKAKRAPDRRPVLETCWRSVGDWVRETLQPKSLFLSGKSMGGRMASYLVADGYPCRGLFFLGYPLHPPGKTEQLRKDHFPRVTVPTLFISGTRDSLCKLELLRPVVDEMGKRATLHVVEGGDHSFKVPKRTGRSEADVANEIVTAIAGWMGGIE
jgi:predicted alpha/beta-hydrolase family hydrolase